MPSPGLSTPLDANNASLLATPKTSPGIAKCPLVVSGGVGTKSPQVGNHFSKLLSMWTAEIGKRKSPIQKNKLNKISRGSVLREGLC